MEKRIELVIAYAISRAVAAKSIESWAVWYAAAGKYDYALCLLRAGFISEAWRSLKSARRATAFARSVK